MKNTTLSLLACIAILLGSCTNKQSDTNYTFHIPDSLIIDADTAQSIPALKKEIADTKLICYLVDSCSRENKIPVEITLNEFGNTIETINDIFRKELLFVKKDSFSITFPQMVGTGKVSFSIDLTDSTSYYIHVFVEPGKINQVWVDLTKSHEYSNIVYSDNIYNALNNAFNKRFTYSRHHNSIADEKFLSLDKKGFIESMMLQHDSIMNCINKEFISPVLRSLFYERAKHNTYMLVERYNFLKQKYTDSFIPKEQYITPNDLQEVFTNLQFNPQWLLYIDFKDCDLLKDKALDIKNYPINIYPFVQLARLCADFEDKLWQEAPEDAANFIEDAFCIEAYKRYRKQSIEAHKRAKGVYVKETPNITNSELFSAIIEKYKGKPIIVNFWGNGYPYSIMDIKVNEAKKNADTTYVYISSPTWSRYNDWNKTINYIKGHHYYLSKESFNYLLNQFGNTHGIIPFKLYIDKNGKVLYSYTFNIKQEITPQTENKLPVYIEDTPNVPNNSLIPAIIEKHKGKPVVIDFWGTSCAPCVAGIVLKEKRKSNDITYIYITCPKESPKKWEETIKDISGHHYNISNQAFYSILEQYNTNSLPFKLYFTKDGQLEKTQ